MKKYSGYRDKEAGVYRGLELQRREPPHYTWRIQEDCPLHQTLDSAI